MYSDGLTSKDYAALLEDTTLTVGEFLETYGHDAPGRIQEVLCALAVHTAREDATIEGYTILTAADLYDIIQTYGYADVFDDVGLERFRPSAADLETLMRRMCEAELRGQ